MHEHVCVDYDYPQFEWMRSNWQDPASCSRLVSGVIHESRSVTSDVRARDMHVVGH